MDSSTRNHTFRLAARPVGLPKPSDWTYAEEPVPELEDGQFLVKVLYISLDPAMRGWMNEGKSYIPPVAIGEVMRAGAAGRVVASKSPAFAEGDLVVGLFGVQEYAVSDGKGVHKVDTSFAPLPVYLGTLGMPGMTAYFGLLDVGRPKEGDTVVVSGAAGAVGTVVGQIAKIKGCRVVGIAGGPEKCRWIVDDLGFDAAPDLYRYDGDAEQVLKRLLNYELPYATVDSALDALAARHLGDGASVAERLYLTAADMTRMAAEGATFGYHTATHRVLSRLNADGQRAELADGPSLVRGLTGQTRVPFCYPYGHRQTYDAVTLALLAELGYDMAFTTARAPAFPARASRFEVPRYDTRDLVPEGTIAPVAAAETHP